VEEVLPAVQQAAGPQGIEVAVATDAVTSPEGGRPGFLSRLVSFLREVQAETKRVTWPSWIELRKATVAIIAFTLVLGIVIGLMDTLLQFLLVTAVAKVF